MNEIIHKIKGYLGCEVPLWCSENILYHDKVINLDELMDNLRISNVCKAINKGDIKLKLRPLDSLTDEELIEICYNICEFEDEYKNQGRERYLFVIEWSYNNNKLSYDVIEGFHSKHIDYQDLIGQGLAVDINEKQGE